MRTTPEGPFAAPGDLALTRVDTAVRPLAEVPPGPPVPVGVGGDELGEGPLWLADRAELWWVDITGRRLHRRAEPSPSAPAGARAVATTWTLPREPGSVLPGEHGGVRLATTVGIEAFDPATGALTLLVPVEADRPDRRMNDVRLDPAGHVWAGTMRFDTSTGPDDGVLYRVDPTGGTHVVRTGIGCPNGMGWPAGDAMVFIDSDRHRIDRWVLDPASRRLVGELEPVDLSGWRGLPDGLALAADGSIWVAFWDGATVRRLAPDGTLLDVVDLPVPHASCPAIVGPDLLVVTSAGGDPDAPADPDSTGPGQLFAVRPAGGTGG